MSPQELTAKVASRFGELSSRLQERKDADGAPLHHPRAIAHFLNRLVFCMFAEDARLLPRDLFARVVRGTQTRPDLARAQLGELFAKMRTGGFFGADVIHWFNGGLFDDADVLHLESGDLKLIADTAAEHDWSQIDPAIFGTLFEQALKATRERPALGAHYTDRDKILKIVEPVIVRPLTAEWDTARETMQAALTEVKAADEARREVLERAADAMRADPASARAGETARRKTLTTIARRRDTAYGQAKDVLEAFLERLAAFRVLDPACGSGNFLYVALHALRDLELRVQMDGERLGFPQQTPRVGLQCIRGIEIEAYAAELARVTLWIGDLQWLEKNGYTGLNTPILSTLDQIENRDALLNDDGTEAQWPAADVIVGNPPFVGDKRQRGVVDGNDLERLRARYEGRVPPSANLVAYWFEKSGVQLRSRGVQRVGLVATQAIRRGASATVLRNAVSSAAIFDAWANEEWALKGAAVRVSIVCWGKVTSEVALNGVRVAHINPDLTSDVASVRPAVLKQNTKVAFQGTVSGGPFEVDGVTARKMLLSPLNPNKKPNSDVLRPWLNGDDLTGRPSDYWLVDFGKATESQAALYENPFLHLKTAIATTNEARAQNGQLPLRAGEPRTQAAWWILQRRRSSSLSKLESLQRYIATPRVSKHRFFT